MAFFICSMNYRTVGSAQRASLAFSAEALSGHLAALLMLPGVEEAVILSTCHRTEFIINSNNINELKKYLSVRHNIAQADFEQWMVVYEGAEAIRHLVALAVGLDSLVLGEPEIFGQLKQAFAVAQQRGAVSSQLQLLFPGVFAVGKKIRHQTQLGRHSLSMTQVVWQWAGQLFADLQQCRVLCIGAGDMNTLVATHALSLGVRSLTVVSRQLARAEALVGRLGDDSEVEAISNIRAMPMAALPALLQEVDMVISATAKPSLVISRDMVVSALRASGRRRPMMMVDMAMPRDIDPEVAQLPDVYLHHLDDLQQVLVQHQGHRSAAAEAAEAMLTPAVAGLDAQLNVARAGRMIDGYRQKAGRITEERVAWACARLRRGDDPEVVVKQLAKQLSQKLLHQPTVDLRTAAAQGEDAMVQQLHQMLMTDVSST